MATDDEDDDDDAVQNILVVFSKHVLLIGTLRFLNQISVVELKGIQPISH
jgi:hypothetical protein